MATRPGKTGGAKRPAGEDENQLARAGQFDLFAPRAAAAEVAAPPAVNAPLVREVLEPASRPVGPRIYTVGELTREIKGELEGRYQRVSVQGEISNLSRPPSGHLYFTLKDADATLSAVLFRNQARLLKFDLQPGQQVVCKGRLTLYEPRGQYQLACDAVEPTGVGALAVAFEQLKARLQQEGLFDAARKRPIPLLPRRIGVVTSPSGAAIRDFLRVLHHRFPSLPVLIAPARVQGDGAGSEVAAGLRSLAAWSARRPAAEQLDVIVVTRGGGSLEDLWAFNEEVLARAIASCPIPVVSAVGHEVDFTIADFVADLRCPTPTAAAERLAPELLKELEHLAIRTRRLHKAVERTTSKARHDLLALRQHLADPRRALTHQRLALDHRAGAMEKALRQRLVAMQQALSRSKERLHRAHPREQLLRHERAARLLRDRLAAAMTRELGAARGQLQLLRERLAAQVPAARVQRAHRTLAERQGELEQLGRSMVAEHRRHFDSQRARLDALSPLKVMSRGYAIAFRADGSVLRSTEGVQPGDELSVRLADQGEVSAQVKRVRRGSVE